MKIDLRWLLLLGTHLVLFYVLLLLNNWSVQHGLQAFIFAPFFLMSATILDIRWAIPVAAFTGLWFDATLPHAFGFHLVLFSVGTFVLHFNRMPMRRAKRGQRMVVAQLVNLVAFSVAAIFLGLGQLTEKLYWTRVLSDLCYSQLLLIPLFWWFDSFQFSLLSILGLDTPLDEQTDRST